MSDTSKRCIICDWPYADSMEKGCVPGNCSYRPDHGGEQRKIQVRRELVARIKAEVSATLLSERDSLIRERDELREALSDRDALLQVEKAAREAHAQFSIEGVDIRHQHAGIRARLREALLNLEAVRRALSQYQQPKENPSEKT